MTLSNQQVISQERVKLGNPYAFLNDEGNLDADIVAQPSPIERVRLSLIKRPSSLVGRYSEQQIQDSVRELQVELWKRYRSSGGRKDIDPTELLSPRVAVEYLGYHFDGDQPLGTFWNDAQEHEVAGMIDPENAIVYVSPNPSRRVRNFTAAHELGHLVLHNGIGLHRDRSIDGSSVGTRDAVEYEADRFAVNFLMPRKLLIKHFMLRFGAPPFVLSEDTLFSLTGRNGSRQKDFPDTRSLSLELAKAERYNGRHFDSLAQQFNVSDVAMAIRLEELELVQSI